MNNPKEKKRVFLPIFIVVIMILSTLGFIIGYSDPQTQNQNKVDYKGFEFTRTEQGTLTGTVYGKQVILINEPSTLEDIPSDHLSLPNLQLAQKVYLTHNPNKTDAKLPIALFEANIKPILKYSLACAEDVLGCEKLPLKTCKDASNSTVIIRLERTNETKITFNNNCLTIQGENLIRPTERAILQLLGAF
ncbi:MAG: hypothetical protein HYS32_02555 [Candidatus Woesearchaeota archaeon]|nr:MAG: hypothetical protein HYS32_02555 [Candidatus Woesearchaeota archaeon]